MWQGKTIFATLSLFLVSACGLQTTQAELPVLDTVAQVEEITQNYAVYFPFDSAKFDVDADTAITAALTNAQQAQLVSIQLRGYTDRAGPAEYNLDLAKHRADAVAAAFVDAGISAGDIEISILGEDEPQTPTLDGQAEATNRRVEIAVVSFVPPKQPEPKQLEDVAATASPPGDCNQLPVYVAGTLVYPCIKSFNRIGTP